MSPKKISPDFVILYAVVFVLSTSQFASAADYAILHNFAGGANDGSCPLGSLIQSGSTLYGMTLLGGSYGNGTIFKINTDNTGFQRLRSFVSAGSDGSAPFGSLLLSGSTLYGMASSDLTSYDGTLFRIGADGSDFQVLRSFSGSDGSRPYNSLILSGSALYGTTSSGGAGGNGALFKINPDGSGFQLLYSFAGGSTDGKWPRSALLQSGSCFYGTTYAGGSGGLGTIYKVNTDGTGFQLLHSFTGGSNDGDSPYFGTLISSGSALYGMTSSLETGVGGTLFRINMDGTDYKVLHSFKGGSNNGRQPYGSLIQYGSTLYGMTSEGGSSGLGTVFQMNIDGTDFELLHSFTGGADGAKPWGSPLLSDSTLYGMTRLGGSHNQGVVFSLTVPEPSTIEMTSIGGMCLLWSWAKSSVRSKQC